jgi:hypothetical protein
LIERRLEAMRSKRSAVVLAILGSLALAVPLRLRADNAWRTAINLAEPTEIPGTVLPPGKYLIKVADTKEIRKVVQVTSADETKVIATFLAIPNYRVRTSGEGEFTYFQRAEGHPQALKSWFYPSNNYGVEFVYPKAEAIKIAESRHEEVYAASSAAPEKPEPIVIVTPELKEVPVKESAPAPASVQAASTPKTLPHTASALPLVALAGLAAIGAASALRVRALRRG